MFKWLAGFAIAAIVAIMGIQFVPVYIQNHAVKKIAQEVVSDGELRTKRDVVRKIEKLFYANDIRSLDPKEVVSVNRDNKGKWVLGIKYEERRNLVYNLGVVADFDDQITN